jgi:hypothetical protein
MIEAKENSSTPLIKKEKVKMTGEVIKAIENEYHYMLK